LASLTLVALHALAQTSNIAVLPPRPQALGFLTRPYQQRIVPPINLANSSRLAFLIRAGNLYLTAQDVIALALENNSDIETQRYGPLLFREDLRRAQVGGNLRVHFPHFHHPLRFRGGYLLVGNRFDLPPSPAAPKRTNHVLIEADRSHASNTFLLRP
jgi:hypothetical protein